MIITDEKKLEKFINLRNQYIDLLVEKKITKLEFNMLNNEIYYKINLRPFVVLDSFNKALFNYNYFNSKAKIYLEDSKKYKNSKNVRDQKRYKLAENNKINCYHHKDKSIIAMINLEKPEKIIAYNIKLHSKNLSNEIFEIYFMNKEKIILHTKNSEIKKLLISLNIFEEKERESLISSYINN